MTTPTIPTPPSHTLFSTSLGIPPHDTTNSPHSTDADDAAGHWPDPFGAMRGHSHIAVTQSIHRDLMPAPQHFSTAGFSVPNFNATIDTSFTPAPTTSMEAFTNLTTQAGHTYPVSTQWLDRQHCLTLPCHRVSLTLGPCWPKVGPVLASAVILRVHR
jgi:hypothetical protein